MQNDEIACRSQKILGLSLRPRTCESEALILISKSWFLFHLNMEKQNVELGDQASCDQALIRIEPTQSSNGTAVLTSMSPEAMSSILTGAAESEAMLINTAAAPYNLVHGEAAESTLRTMASQPPYEEANRPQIATLQIEDHVLPQTPPPVYSIKSPDS